MIKIGHGKKAILWPYAKSLRNDTKAAIRRAKANFIQMNLDYESNNPKKFWEKIHLLLPKKNLSNHISLIDKETNEPIPDHETADYINNYFAIIGSKLAEKFDTHWSFDGDNTEVMMDTLIIYNE